MRAAACILVAVLTGGGVRAADAHLDVIPRTPEEAARVAAVTAPPAGFSRPEPFEERPGGAATAMGRTGAHAFSYPSANMAFARELDFKVGNGFFRRVWVTAPASTASADGLGPLYNARACQRCHLRDGRGHPPEGPDDNAVSMVLRVSVPAAPGDLAPELAAIEGYLATLPDPVYGGQLQDFAIAGHVPEYRLAVVWEEHAVTLAGGAAVSLRRPVWGAADPGHGPLASGAMLSPRVAPPMIGLGLVEAIPEADILAHADPDDADGDGISGRPNIVWSAEFGRPMLGRFGLKAGMATVREQAAAAFSGDMGLSTSLFPAAAGDCTPAEVACLGAPHGADADGLEVSDQVLDLVAFYSRNLAVPGRRGVGDPEVLAGKALFHGAGCAACHVPKFVTHRLADRPEQSFQLVWPHSDFLLHDMGEGLADHRPEARATGREWRTAPLWGIGLTEAVSGRATFLHDGRARSLAEAILWHGGEAAAARDAFAAMAPADRARLLAFLGSL